MSVIEASSVGVRTMVDGTLRLTVDIEPRHAQDAFRLFGAPGTAMALAALKAAEPQKEEPPKPQHPIVQWLALRCREREFQEYIAGYSECLVTNEQSAANVVRALLGVSSRSDVPGNEVAETKFEKLRKAYSQFLKNKETV